MPYNINTLCIHCHDNSDKDHPFGAITVPIYQAATFAHPGIGESTGYDYSRESNPTRAELEKVMKGLENAYDSIACNSGMAAITLMLDLFKDGDNIICSEDLYGGSVRIFNTVGKEKGISFDYVDSSDADLVEKSIKSNTKALFIETPSNPTMLVTDLHKMKEIASKHNLLLIIDNTFLSPYFCRPLELGADIVLHSGTKFLGGHNDTLAGFISVKDKNISEKMRFTYKTLGLSLSAFDSYLILRGIKTLGVRLERQEKNAMKIAEFLKNHPKVIKLMYIGLKEHKGHDIHLRQASGFGSMISFVTDNADTARKALEKIKLISYAESLGGVESLMTYPMIQTHGDVPVEVRERLGINDRFLRLSVGLEDADDLIKDLEQALA